MRKVMAVAFIVFLCSVVWLGMIGCTAQQIADSASAVKEVATNAAPLLPPPFGVIAGLVAGAAGIVVSIAAGKVKGGAVATNTTPHPVADFLSSHSWIYPTVAAGVGFANSMGWLHVSPAELATFASAMGVATVTQVASDAHAENQAPATPAPAKAA